ncbi:hypothetical protein NDU88_008005 [Pleurodeles waltl]|uniref:Uncharacterized protein n=1 Tax=Pleurodeles waltl TaxID=8319 RepID=A0AAV7VTW2_PLEWA|nr:hypothetical protein NDU88_008005 [Pleurodeles waltl]
MGPPEIHSIAATWPLWHRTGHVWPGVLCRRYLPSDLGTQRPDSFRLAGHSPAQRGRFNGARLPEPPRGYPALPALDCQLSAEPPGPGRVAAPRQGSLHPRVQLTVRTPVQATGFA